MNILIEAQRNLNFLHCRPDDSFWPEVEPHISYANRPQRQFLATGWIPILCPSTSMTVSGHRLRTTYPMPIDPKNSFWSEAGYLFKACVPIVFWDFSVLWTRKTNKEQASNGLFEKIERFYAIIMTLYKNSCNLCMKA